MKQTDSSNLDLSDISPGFCNLWPILLSHSRSNCVWQKVMVDGWQYYGNILSLPAFSSQLLSSHHCTNIGHSLRILMLNCSVSFHLWKCLPCNFQITFHKIFYWNSIYFSDQKIEETVSCLLWQMSKMETLKAKVYPFNSWVIEYKFCSKLDPTWIQTRLDSN